MAETQCTSKTRVEQLEYAIAPFVELEDVVMIRPENSNHHKTENVGKVGRPQREQG